MDSFKNFINFLLNNKIGWFFLSVTIPGTPSSILWIKYFNEFKKHSLEIRMILFTYPFILAVTFFLLFIYLDKNKKLKSAKAEIKEMNEFEPESGILFKAQTNEPYCPVCKIALARNSNKPGHLWCAKCKESWNPYLLSDSTKGRIAESTLYKLKEGEKYFNPEENKWGIARNGVLEEIP